MAETLQEWAVRIKGAAVNCDFGNMLDTALRDKFITGMEPGRVLDRLFSEDNKLTFNKAMEIAQATHEAQLSYGIHQEAVTEVKEEAIHRLHQGPRGPSTGSYKMANSGGGIRKSAPQMPSTMRNTKRCHRCGRDNHTADRCRYRSYTCNNCGMKGHLSNVCNNKKKFNNLEISSSLALFQLKSRKFDPLKLKVMINEIPLFCRTRLWGSFVRNL